MDKETLLYFGSEDEFFTGEIKELVLQAVANRLRLTKPKTIRSDVLWDVLGSNGGVKRILLDHGFK